MPDARKKVILRTVTDALHPGYLPLANLISPSSNVDLLDLDARIVSIPLKTVRWIAYVRDFNLSDTRDPECLTRRTFLARPRAEGLWLRITMLNNEILEGLAPIDLSLIDGLLDDRGLYLIPPDIRSNTQRLYLPRASFLGVQLLAVITNPSKPKPSLKQSSSIDRKQQDFLFE